MSLVSELRRRNVLRMAVLYAVAAWLIMQVAEVMMSVVGLPAWAGRAIFILLAVGFPIALILSWFYEITPQGVVLEKDVDRAESVTHVTGRRLDFIVISLLCAAVILFAYDKWWIGGPPAKSIAVLPFENMSADPEQEYFSDGISEELLNLLAQIPELTVISRSSAFSFKGQHLTIAAIARQLHVAHVLEGSVRKVGNRVRITAQLIEASSDSHLWSASYDRELDDIFAVTDEIAAAISDALKVKLALVAGEPVLPTSVKAANTEAYDAYLRGRELIHLRGVENLQDAIRHLQRSLRLDEGFAPAHAQLAIATTLLPSWDESTMRATARRTAISQLDRAEELEPDLADAHGGRALLALDDDPESAIEDARKALASNPSYVDAMNWLRIALNALGRYEEADATLKHMLVTDPLNIVGRYSYASLLRRTGRVAEAHEIADQLLAESELMGYWAHADTSLINEGKIAESLSWALRGRTDTHVMVAFIRVGEYDEARRITDDTQTLFVDFAEGRFDEAITAAYEGMLMDPDDELLPKVTADLLYMAGRVDEALPLFERDLDSVAEGRPLSEPYSLIRTMQLALARRKAGDEEGAQAAAQIVRQDYAARRAARANNQFQHRAEAMMAAFEHNPDRVLAALKSAMQLGLRDAQVFDDPMFEELRDEPPFVALRQELEAILAAEHDQVLQLICFHNPVPDDWQPMPETCEGVVEQRRL